MDDITIKIYEALINNEEIIKLVPKNNIKFFDYPNAQEIKDIVIVIDPLDTPTPSDYADNDNLTYEYFYQIDVFVKQKQGVNLSLIHISEPTRRLSRSRMPSSA